MFITVAGEKKEVKDGLTLPELIAQENVEMPEYVTVSINEEFVASEDKRGRQCRIAVFHGRWMLNGNDR